MRKIIVTVPPFSDLDAARNVIQNTISNVTSQIQTQAPINDFQGQRIINVADPKEGTDAVNLETLNQALFNLGTSTTIVSSVATGTSTAAPTPLAPNVTSASVTITIDASLNAVASGSFTLPTGDPHYSHDHRVDVMAQSPSGDLVLISTILGSPVGSPQSFSGVVEPQPTSDESWNFYFICYNEDGVPTPSPFSILGVTIPAAALLSVSGLETGPVYQDFNQGLHTIITLTPVYAGSQVGLLTYFWVDFGNGDGWIYQDSLTPTTIGESVVLGQQTKLPGKRPTGGSIWVPTDPSQTTWQVAASLTPGTENTPGSGYVSASFTVNVAQPCHDNDCTNITFIRNPADNDQIDYTLGDPGVTAWIFHELDWTQPTAEFDVYYQYSMATVQKGAFYSGGAVTVTGGTNVQITTSPTHSILGGVFTLDSSAVGDVIHINSVRTTIATFVDATHFTTTDSLTNGSGLLFWVWVAAPDREGVNEDPAIAYYGREFGDSGNINGGAEQLGSVVSIVGDLSQGWTMPSQYLADGVTTNVYLSFKIEIYAVSRLGQNPSGGTPGGTYTRQLWPDSRDFFILTPTLQAATLDARRLASAGLGTGVKKDSVSGRLRTANGAGLTDDGTNNVVNNGYTIGINGSGQVVLNNVPVVAGLPSLPSSTYPQGSVIVDALDNYMVYRNSTGTAWTKTTDPTALVAGTIAAGVIYAGTINCSQINAGTIDVALTLTSPTIVVTDPITGIIVNIDTGNYIKVSKTSVTEYTQMLYSEFQSVSSGSGRSAGLSPFGLSVTDGTNNATVGTQGFGDLGTGTAFTGTLAAAISAGKNVVGGVIQN